jgi:hypothetical protein
MSILIVAQEINKTEGDKSMIAVYAVDRWFNTQPGKSPQEIVAFLKDNGVNTVFGGYDEPDFRIECKKQGIKVYADVLCFQGEKHWKSHPESRPINAEGNPIPKEEWYCGVCPNQPWLQDEILERVKKLFTQHQVDGIWLDFIRYPCHWEVKDPLLYQSCFCNVCIPKFERDTGISIPADKKSDKKATAEFILSQHSMKWASWKCSCVAGFVKRVVETAKGLKPDATVGLFGVPWKVEERDGAIRAIVGQDFKLLSESGVDIFSPMVYHKLCYRDVRWISDTAHWMKALTGKRVIPIVQACSVPDTLPNEEFADAVKAGLASPSEGVIIFHATYLEKEKKWDSFKSAVK